MTDKKNNTGKENSGSYNSGYRNSGDYNSGDCNSGNYNSGYRNSGDSNSGDRNSGNYNSGDCNSGYRNSGHYNSGHSNSGDYNSGSYNSGFFNTNEPTMRLFNKETGLKRSEIDIPYIYLPVEKWISESDMTEEQKKADPDFHVKGGTLTTQPYKDAWKEVWPELGSETKERFKNLPNFCPDVFEEITGIRVDAEPSCDGNIVEIDGKRYRLEEV